MPSVPTFIRDENFDTWRKLKDYKGGRTQGGGQAAWLNERLSEERDRQQRQADRQISLTAPHLRPTPKPRPLDDIMGLLDGDKAQNHTQPEPPVTPFVPSPPDPETGYPCCTGTKPCKHWSFDGTSGLWINELTGKTREVA